MTATRANDGANDGANAGAKRGLAPLACEGAHILILGSLPGDRSLRAQQYYAHPQNQFWRLIAAIFGTPEAQSYERRCALLRRHRIAVWDVLAAASRAGSLDTAIKNPTANDFSAFLAEHSNLDAICFNGQMAAALFKRHVERGQGLLSLPIEKRVLPSTSPAAARLTFEDKLALWRPALTGNAGGSTARR